MNAERIVLYKYIILFTFLVIVSIIDLRKRIIPIPFIIIGISLGLFINIYLYKKIYILGFLFGGFIPLLITFISDDGTGRGAIGGGDIYLLAILGLWVGFENITNIMLILFTIASIIIGISLVLKKLNLIKGCGIAFAPYITFSTMYYFIFNYYMGRGF